MSSTLGAAASLPASPAPAGRRAPRNTVPVPRGLWFPQWLWAWPFPLAVLLLWQVSSTLGWVPEQVLPAPAQVFRTFGDMVVGGEIWSHLAISLLRVFTGFGIGLLGGLALGAVMGLSPTARDYLYPLFKAFAQVPVIGWLPLLMLIVGIDETLKFLLIAKATLVPVTLNTCQGIQGVPNRFIEVARIYGFTRWQLLTQVVFPAATAPIWNGAWVTP